MSSPWVPCREPFRTTLARTGMIALIGGTFLALAWHRWDRWPLAVLLILWPALGGHFVELAFLNVLRPLLPRARAAQTTARLTLWFAGGVLLLAAMRLTDAEISGMPIKRWPPWWTGGVGFIAIELFVHAMLQLRRQPNFYNGRG